MPAVVFLTHIPLLRLEQDEVPFAGGELTRLPWELYDQVSLGAFSDFRSLYEKTAPVFYRVDFPDLPRFSSAPSDGGMMELTTPAREWEAVLPELGLAFLLSYSDLVVELAWTALLLAAAAAAPPRPRLSVTFVMRGEEDASFEWQEHRFDGIRVSGETNQQLLFSPRAAGAEIGRDVVERANELVPVVETAARHPRLVAAIQVLQATTHPSLSSREQTTLGVVGLESLLLPEVKSDLSETFARRVATLLASGQERPSLERAAVALYEERSTSLHGESPHRSAAAPTDRGYAQQLLAAAIEALARATGEDGDVARVCDDLDEGKGGGVASPPDPHAAPGLAAVNRLTARRPKFAVGLTVGAAESMQPMEPPEGVFLSWSPLVGLTSEIDLEVDEGVVLTTRSPASILTLEDKDVQRELGDVRMAETHVACLAIARPAQGEALDDLRDSLLRTRDLTVIALRLAGFSAFVDPELLGSYTFDGRGRTIATTVLAPTILRAMVKEPSESFGPDDASSLASTWQILAEYEANARHDDVDHALTLFRRAHDDVYVPPSARANLLLATIEAMLGRFRPKDDVQLEDLVLAVAGSEDEDAIWFKESGRKFRNAVAHGYWDGDTRPLNSLQTLAGRILLAWVSACVDHEQAAGPGLDFVDDVIAGMRA